MKYFLKNLWRFRKILWNYRTWDWAYCINLFADSLEWLSKDIEKGPEEDRARIKKVNAINELVVLLRHMTDDTEYSTFMEESMEEIYKITPEDLHERTEQYKKNRTLTLDRIHEIIKGQSSLVKTDYDNWVEHFDGTGIEGWWN